MHIRTDDNEERDAGFEAVNDDGDGADETDPSAHDAEDDVLIRGRIRSVGTISQNDQSGGSDQQQDTAEAQRGVERKAGSNGIKVLKTK